jgi:hypothetical protein
VSGILVRYALSLFVEGGSLGSSTAIRDFPRNLKTETIARYELALPDKELRVIPNPYDVFAQHNVGKRLRVSFTNYETTRKFIEAGLVISISSDVIIGEHDELLATPLTHLFREVEYGLM